MKNYLLLIALFPFALVHGQVYLPSQIGSPNNNVGINQNSPTARLHISDDITKTNCESAILINTNIGNSAVGDPTQGPESVPGDENTCTTPYAFRVLTNNLQSVNRIMVDIKADGKAHFGNLQDVSTPTTFLDVEDNIGVYSSNGDAFTRLGSNFGMGVGSNLNWYNSNNDPFQISYGLSTPNNLFTLEPSGEVGLGTENPVTSLHIVNEDTEADNGPTGETQGLLVENNGTRDEDFAVEVRTGQANNFSGRVFSISNAGTVIIGSGLNWSMPLFQNQRFNLFVENGIRTESLRIDLAAANGWADHVFDEDYSLLPLSELASFIKVNKHLPDVPKESQLEVEGMDVSEMLSVQMEKIEELTLYIIELENRIKKLEQ